MELPEGIGVQFIIGIKAHDVCALGFPEHLLPGAGDALVLPVDHTDLPGVAFLPPVADHTAAVSGAVIYQHHLKICKVLGKNAFQTTVYILLHIIYGDQNREKIHRYNLLSVR